MLQHTPSQPKTQFDNYQWCVDRINQSRTKQELNLVAIEIGCDVFDNLPWTADKERIESLRELFKSRTRDIDVRLRMEQRALEPTGKLPR